MINSPLITQRQAATCTQLHDQLTTEISGIAWQHGGHPTHVNAWVLTAMSSILTAGRTQRRNLPFQNILLASSATALYSPLLPLKQRSAGCGRGELRLVLPSKGGI